MFSSILKRLADLNRDQIIFLAINLSIFLLPFLIIKKVLNRAGSGIFYALRTNQFELQASSCTGTLLKYTYALSDVLMIGLFLATFSIGCLYFIKKFCELSKFNQKSINTSNANLPNTKEWGAGFLIAFLLVALETYLAAGMHRLDFMPYDGMGSIKCGISIYDSFIHGNFKNAFAQSFNGINGSWGLLFALNFSLFGTGEWQIYAVRFYPILISAVLVCWASRDLGKPWLKILPIVFFLFSRLNLFNFYLLSKFDAYKHMLDSTIICIDDIRPDYFSSILLLFSITILAKSYLFISKKCFSFSSLLLSLSMLSKPTMAPYCLLMWSIAVCVLAWNHRNCLKVFYESFIVALIPLIGVLFLITLSGGLVDTVLYHIEQQSRKWIYGGETAGLWFYYISNYHYYFSTIHMVIFLFISMFFFIKRKELSNEVSFYSLCSIFTFIILGMHFFKNPSYGITFFALLSWLGTVLLIRILDLYKDAKIWIFVFLSLIFGLFLNQIYIVNILKKWDQLTYGINAEDAKNLEKLTHDINTNQNNTHLIAVPNNSAMPEALFIRNYIKAKRKDLSCIKPACFAMSEADAQKASKDSVFFQSLSAQVNKSCKLILVSTKHTAIADPLLKPFHDLLRHVVEHNHYKRIGIYNFTEGLRFFQNFEGSYELYQKQ